jgi:hypothetical protein
MTNADLTTPNDLPSAWRDLIGVLAEALDLPLPSTDQDDENAYHRLLARRVTYVRILLESLASHPSVSINGDPQAVRTHIEQTPIIYTTFDTERARSKRRGGDL